MKELDECHQRAHEAIDLAARNRIAGEYSLQLAYDVLMLLRRVSAAEADGRRLSVGIGGPVDAARFVELERQLAEMTEREARWRKECLALGERRMRESTSAFRDFCDGHKAGMKQAGER